MLKFNIPGRKEIKLEHLVLDFNGTLAIDGKLISGVKERLEILAKSLKIHIITADSFGTVHNELTDLPVTISVLSPEDQDQKKLKYVQELGIEKTACIGNGLNDNLMVKEAILGISLIQTEGAASQSLLNTDIVCPDINSALELFYKSNRLKATLRI
ncbi:MAG TPA: ATPase P [Candidatus Cloacimonetes bacterium]|nr:ATPase P [Candidatus Cloacimonadota bacterium]